MSDLDLAVRRSKRLEALLRDGLGATGRGLHEKTSSVEAKLPADLVRRLRFVATIRNKIVHDLDYDRMDDRGGFISACDECERRLEALAGPGVRDSLRLPLLVGALVLALIVVGVIITVVMMRSHGLDLDFSLT